MKKKVSKTEAIREVLKATNSPSKVAAILKKQGVKVSPQYVSTIKANDKRRSELGRAVRKPGRPTKSAPTPTNSDIEQASELVLQAVELVMLVGGKEARQLIDQAERLVAKIRG